VSRTARALGLYVAGLPGDTRTGAERWAIYSAADGAELLNYFPRRARQEFLWTCGRERGFVRHWKAALVEARKRDERRRRVTMAGP
jgi:hypothetical protein